MKSPWVYPWLVTFEATSRFNEIQQGGHAIEGDLNTININLITSTVPKWPMFKFLRWVQNLHHSMSMSLSSSSSSYSITNLGQGGLFQSEHSHHPVIFSVVIQVIILILDDNLEVI
jgi:hypothetical protein